MLEPIMFMGIGFLAASLLILGLAPVVHARAVRLTERRFCDAIPTTVEEMQAEKDLLRATFAMSIRRLEIALEHSKMKAAGYLSEIGKKSNENHILKMTLKKAVADHRCEIAKRADEVQHLTAELGKIAELSPSLDIPERQQPSPRQNRNVNWPAFASASALMICLVLLGLNFGRNDQKGQKVALIIRGDSTTAGGTKRAHGPQLPLHRPAISKARAQEVEKVGPVKSEADSVSPNAPASILIIRGGRRNDVGQPIPAAR
jgi:predicted RecB family endonuclease